MKRITVFVLAIFLIATLSNCENDEVSCSESNTGSISIVNDGLFLPSGQADFYIGGVKIASLANNEEKTINGLSIGEKLLTVIVMPDTIYQDLVTIALCETLNYSTTEYDPTSDQRLKENIQPIDNALSLIEQLIPYTYDYKTSTLSQQYLPDGIHYGYMAQDILQVFPSFVKLHDDGFYSVNYAEMIPILTKGIQEQQAQINALENQIEELKAMMITAGK